MADYDNEDLTERYLLNRLSEEEMADFQARLLHDTRLRREVRIMRNLQKSLIAERRSARKAKRLPWHLFIGLAGVAVALAGLLIYLSQPSDKATPDIPSAPLPSEMPVQQPVQDDNPSKPMLQKPDQEKPMAPVASNFSVNPILERYIDNNVRGGNGHLDVAFPPAGSRFKRENGKIFFQLSGTLEGSDEVPDYSVNVFIFSNRKEDYENSQSQWEKHLNFLKESGRFRLSIAEKVALYPGLYYFLIENEESGEVLKVGKFTVE